MKKIVNFIKREPVFLAGTLLMLVSMFFVKPSANYVEYIDFRVLALLFCLMAVVAGLKEAGVFVMIANGLGRCVKTVRSFSMVMCIVCFFAAMLITNDVALITFVPLTLIMLKGQKETEIIKVVVLETVAVNLGSMLTPIGNPQNLYLFSCWGVSVITFVREMLPLTLLSLVLVMISVFFLPKTPLIREGEESENQSLQKHEKLKWLKIICYILMFILCLLNVFHVVEYWIVLLTVFAAVLIIDRKVLLRVDYFLLFTFVVFFVFIGNLGQIEVVREFLQSVIGGHELIIGILSSQAFSNVPAAMLLSTFSDDIRDLLWGVNIGGLGTLIASMASLISFKLYAVKKGATKRKYMLIFTIVNIVFLAVLLAFALCVYR